MNSCICPCGKCGSVSFSKEYLLLQLNNYKMQEIRQEEVRQEKLRELRESITPKELRVLQKLGLGLTTREIAERMCVCPKTVEAHRAHLRRKLGASNTAELSYWIEVAGEVP